MKNGLTCDLPLETVVSKDSARQLTAQPPRAVIAGAVVGRLVGLEQAGGSIVDFPGNTSGELLVALSVLEPTTNDVGREVVLMFEEGDPSRPIVLGFLHEAAEGRARRAEKVSKRPREIALDGERLIFTAEKEIVLRCGRASITLTRAGKVLIRGAYLLSRSSGANRIKGGSVQIN